MITNFKVFENVGIWPNGYMLGEDQFFINDVMEYLGVDVDIMTIDENTELESPYFVNVIDFIKEIILDKTIIFQCKDAIMKDPTLNGEVINVDTFFYKDEFWFKVKLKKPKYKYDNKWYNCRHPNDKEYLMKNNSIITISDYDANSKPLHKLVELKKRAKKYNI
jgi:hypothetical protein